MFQVGQDLRHAMRRLFASPLATTVIVLSLSVGIGATSSVFGLVNALLLRPLPVPDAERLVRIGRTERGEGFLPVSYPEYQELAAATPALGALVGHHPNTVVLGLDGDAGDEMAEVVTGNYFTALGLEPALGRGFAPEEDRTPESHPVVVLGHGLWQRRFAGRPDVIGRVVSVNGRAFTVIGVAPEGFRGTFPGFDVSLWVPVMMAQTALREAPLGDRMYRFLMLVGRLADGADREQVRVQLDEAADRLAAAEAGPGARIGFALADADGVHPLVATLVRAFLGILMTVVGLLLLVACANVAILLLARAEARRSEMAIRAALGAARGRTVRLLLTESLLLAALGGLGGLAVGVWCGRLLSTFRPPVGVPIAIEPSPDATVLLFTLAVTTATAVIFGLAPALHATSAAPWASLRGVRSAGGRVRVRWRDWLVVMQVAISAVVLVGGLLLLRSLARSRVLDPGFDSERMLVLALDPALLGHGEDETRALWTRLVTGVGSIPGVESVTMGLMVPMGDRADQMSVSAANARSDPTVPRASFLDYNLVAAGYFDAMGIDLVDGREFGADDVEGAEEVAVVSETLADRLWPRERAVGEDVRVVDRGGAEHVARVVGVTADFKFRTWGEAPRPVLFLPQSQWYRSDMRIHVRLAADATAVVPAIREVVRSVDAALGVEVTTLTDEMAFSLVPVRLAGVVLGFSGVLGLLLAGVGLFGVLAYSVARRRREIGIRIAIGARPWQVARLVVGRALFLTAAGLVPGLVIAGLVSPVLRGMLAEIAPRDPGTFGAIALIFVCTSLLASGLPTRRAIGTQPFEVLREE